MPESQVLSFQHDQVPPHLACQIRSYARVQWPFMTGNNRKIWNPVTSLKSYVHFVAMDDELLISHAGVNSRELAIGNEILNVFGLSTVFTYPDYRGSGHARRVVEAATDYTRSTDADVSMLFCGERVKTIYLRCGWEHINSARIFYGDPANPKLKDDNLIMMLFVSEKGRKSRPIFEREEVYVGPDTW